MTCSASSSSHPQIGEKRRRQVDRARAVGQGGAGERVEPLQFGDRRGKSADGAKPTEGQGLRRRSGMGQYRQGLRLWPPAGEGKFGIRPRR